MTRANKDRIQMKLWQFQYFIEKCGIHNTVIQSNNTEYSYIDRIEADYPHDEPSWEFPFSPRSIKFQRDAEDKPWYTTNIDIII